MIIKSPDTKCDFLPSIFPSLSHFNTFPKEDIEFQFDSRPNTISSNLKHTHLK
jgi:hypothetical protein